MQRLLLAFALLLLTLGSASAQKFAFVDTDYILGKIPAYRSAQERLETYSNECAQEVQNAYAAIEKKLKDFQSEQVLLTQQQRQKKQQEIIDAEAAAKELQQKYFGNEGTVAAKQKELIQPIQDQVYNAVKELANEGGYAAIIDVASSASVLYSSPRYDKSDDVLAKLGYK